MRPLLVLCLAVSLAGCDRDGRGQAGASLLSESGGEVALSDGSSFDFRITSEKYKQWDVAQRGISKRIAARFGAILRPDAPTERSIASAVTYLEGQPGARQAIEGAGMSVRDFVVMTVALEQEMRLASREQREPAPASEAYDFPPVDTTFVAPFRRDTALPRPDSTRRDSIPRPVTRDTVRDTTPPPAPVPPDTIPT